MKTKETKKTTAKAKKTKKVSNVNPELLEEGTDLNAITPSNLVETMFPHEEEKDENILVETMKPKKAKKEKKLSQAEIDAKAAMEAAKAALKKAREDAKAEATKKKEAAKKPEKRESELKKAMTRIESVVAAIKANAELRKDTKELAKVADVLFINAGGVTNEKESFVNARMTLKVLEAWEKA